MDPIGVVEKMDRHAVIEHMRNTTDFNNPIDRLCLLYHLDELEHPTEEQTKLIKDLKEQAIQDWPS